MEPKGNLIVVVLILFIAIAIFCAHTLNGNKIRHETIRVDLTEENAKAEDATTVASHSSDTTIEQNNQRSNHNTKSMQYNEQQPIKHIVSPQAESIPTVPRAKSNEPDRSIQNTPIHSPNVPIAQKPRIDDQNRSIQKGPVQTHPSIPVAQQPKSEVQNKPSPTASLPAQSISPASKPKQPAPNHSDQNVSERTSSSITPPVLGQKKDVAIQSTQNVPPPSSTTQAAQRPNVDEQFRSNKNEMRDNHENDEDDEDVEDEAATSIIPKRQQETSRVETHKDASNDSIELAKTAYTVAKPLPYKLLTPYKKLASRLCNNPNTCGNYRRIYSEIRNSIRRNMRIIPKTMSDHRDTNASESLSALSCFAVWEYVLLNEISQFTAFDASELYDDATRSWINALSNTNNYGCQFVWTAFKVFEKDVYEIYANLLKPTNETNYVKYLLERTIVRTFQTFSLLIVHDTNCCDVLTKLSERPIETDELLNMLTIIFVIANSYAGSAFSEQPSLLHVLEMLWRSNDKFCRYLYDSFYKKKEKDIIADLTLIVPGSRLAGTCLPTDHPRFMDGRLNRVEGEQKLTIDGTNHLLQATLRRTFPELSTQFVFHGGVQKQNDEITYFPVDRRGHAYVHCWCYDRTLDSKRFDCHAVIQINAPTKSTIDVQTFSNGSSPPSAERGRLFIHRFNTRDEALSNTPDATVAIDSNFLRPATRLFAVEKSSFVRGTTGSTYFQVLAPRYNVTSRVRVASLAYVDTTVVSSNKRPRFLIRLDGSAREITKTMEYLEYAFCPYRFTVPTTTTGVNSDTVVHSSMKDFHLAFGEKIGKNAVDAHISMIDMNNDSRILFKEKDNLSFLATIRYNEPHDLYFIITNQRTSERIGINFTSRPVQNTKFMEHTYTFSLFLKVDGTIKMFVKHPSWIAATEWTLQLSSCEDKLDTSMIDAFEGERFSWTEADKLLLSENAQTRDDRTIKQLYKLK